VLFFMKFKVTMECVVETWRRVTSNREKRMYERGTDTFLRHLVI
jgi:hypothetical protein